MQGKVEISGVNTAKLKTLSNEEMMHLIELAQAGDEQAKQKLVEGNLKLVLSVIQRFMGRGENPDDLFQVGCIGLLKAIANFDTSKQVRFSTYGVPMIAGELRRYLRDYSPIRVSRSVRDTAYRVLQCKQELVEKNGREPTMEEIARAMDVPLEEVVGAMDARRSQVYNAVFEAKGGELTRLTPDRAISLEDLCAQLQGKQQPITVLGDGGVLCYRYLEEHGVKCSLAPAALLYQNAVGVGLAAERAYARGETVSAQELLPVYLRPAQAERLRNAKLDQ